MSLPSATTSDRSTDHYDAYWQNVDGSYPHYPTIRHRKRFIFSTLRRLGKHPFSVFDFGCGEADLLADIQREFHLSAADIGGSDISEMAVREAQKKVPGGLFVQAAFPVLPRTYDVIICSEVIEHTVKYREVLEWIYRALAPGSILILTTQAGKRHASDHYTGHTQHFKIDELTDMLEQIGYGISRSALWGWPFFTLQKHLTNLSFDRVKGEFLEGGLSTKKKIVFSIAYGLYFVHDLIPFGPQIYIVARKGS